MPLRLRIEGRAFFDAKDREVTIRGINCAADAKFPASPNIPSHVSDQFFDGDNVSFIGRPFSVDEAHTHFARLRRYGYNTLRYIFTWEAIEHAGPGRYDEEWIQHTIGVLRLARGYGFYIFMDPHQDVWSRFSGGSGAPLWTVYAAGLNPRAFAATEAAIVHNTSPDPAKFTKMIWSSNYTRLACQVIFTLFFAGRDFAPKAIIDGKNIQDYLQDHFVAACKHLAHRIHEAADLENEVVIGWESMNEPNRGLVGWPDLSTIPSEQKLQLGTSPTAWQGILTGSGRACEVETWAVGGMGPYKTGTQLVDPQDQTAWLAADYDDSNYGWSRNSGWKLGECLWAQHGIWDPTNDRLLKKDYFAKHPTTGEHIDYQYFTNHYFMAFYRRYRNAIVSVHEDAIMFCQPPVLEIPPSLKDTQDDDPNMVYAPHYYDGLTLMTKKWNRFWNLDLFGLMRGRYSSPAFAIKIGETAIRNCLRDQLGAIKKEGEDYMGTHPCVFTEIGIPFDMDDKYAYKTGDYISQIRAMDANHFALEGSGANGFTLWVYVATNNHQWGDLWNGEDLSVYSVDDKPLPMAIAQSQSTNASTISLSNDRSSPSYSQSRSSESNQRVTPSTLKRNLSTPSISPTIPRSSTASFNTSSESGYRATEAYIRPSPMHTVGLVDSYGFDLRNAVFTLALTCQRAPTEDFPTEIFLPEFHFPKEEVRVEVSSGKWTIGTDDDEKGSIQKLRWWHGVGKQNISVKGVRRKAGLAVGDKEDNEGYYDQCQKSRCDIM